MSDHHRFLRRLARRHLLAAGLGVLLCATCLLPAQAQVATTEKFPSQPVTIVVPFPAGGSTDYVARAMAQSLSEGWKVPVLVENRVGAGGNIGADFVARAPANGHTVLMGAVSTVTNPPLYKLAPYIPRLLVPIGVGVASPLVTVVRSDLPAADVPALLALSRSKAGGLNAGSAGAGTLSHLGLELLEADHKGNLHHVPYKGSTPALTDVMGGQVDLMIDTVVSASPAIASGKVKALAVHTPRRIPTLPNVPTYEEQGLKGMSFSAWNVFMVPVGTPPERIATLHAAMSRAVREPAMARGLGERGLEIIVQTPAESLDAIRSEAQRWEKVIRDKNIGLQ